MSTNQLVSLMGTSISMTSKDIAELVESRHDSVKRTIETLSEKGVIELPQTVEIPTATKPTKVYRFTGEQGKRDSIIVVAQLSPEFTARLVDRWQELETQLPHFKIPQSFSEALMLAANLQVEKEHLLLENKQQQQKITEDQPKVELILFTLIAKVCKRREYEPGS